MIVKKTIHLEEDGSEGYIECIFDSSNILMSTYFPLNETLYISFNRGGVYSYGGVDQEKYDQFESSDSQGKFFIKEIKGGDHPFKNEYKLFESEITAAKDILNEWKENHK
jgi:hypothetical protein